MNPIKFIKSVIAEVRLVEWLSKKELIYYSWIVILFLIFSTIVVALLDIGFVTLRTFVINLF